MKKVFFLDAEKNYTNKKIIAISFDGKYTFDYDEGCYKDNAFSKEFNISKFLVSKETSLKFEDNSGITISREKTWMLGNEYKKLTNEISFINCDNKLIEGLQAGPGEAFAVLFTDKSEIIIRNDNGLFELIIMEKISS